MPLNSYPILISFVFLFPTLSMGNELSPDVMNLIQAYQLAQQHDSTFAAEQAVFLAGQEQQQQSRASLLPRIDGAANYDFAYDIDDSKGLTSKGASIRLSYPLYRKSNQILHEQAKVRVNQAEIQLLISKQELALRVATAYFKILSATESVGVAASQKAAFAENLERAKLAYRIGTATITDKLEAQARFDLARATEITEQNNLEIAKQSLKSVIGIFPNHLFGLREDAKLQAVNPQNMEYWVKQALQNNPQIQFSTQSLSIASQEISRAKSERLPVVDVTSSLAHSQQDLFRLNRNTVGIGIQLNVPLYTGGLTSSRIRAASANRDQQTHQLDKRRREITLKTQQTYLTLRSGWLRIDAFKQALASSQSVLDATKKGLEVGVRTNLDVLDALQQFFATQRDLTLAKYDYLLGTLELKAAVGQIDESEINEINALLTRLPASQS